MKQITPEIKARIFALYWKQKIWSEKSRPNCLDLIDAYLDYDPDDISAFEDAVLVVKPLSSITDEDSIEVLKLLGLYKNYSYTISVKDFVLGVLKKVIKVEVADYLRSKSYALPAFGFSVDELVEAGVFKLKEVNND